jgi:hypothetical protein
MIDLQTGSLDGTIKEDHVIGIWFTGCPFYDWLASGVARDGEIIGYSRHRYYNDDKVWDSEDEKSGYKIGPLKDTPEERKKMRDTFDLAFRMARNPIFQFKEFYSFEGGTATEAIEWLKKQPFAHMRKEPLPPASSLVH